MTTDAVGLPPVLRYSTLEPSGVSRRQLAALARDGDYERVAPGVFVQAGLLDDTAAAWASIAARRDDATLCLLTALSLHDLTDEIPQASDVALPRGAHPLVVEHAPMAWHYFAIGTFDVGRETHQLAPGLTIGLYGPERTIIDVFRLRRAWGSDLAIEALKRWLRRPGSSPSNLLSMARRFPAARPALQAALEVLL